jgi:hypothetical protein
LQVVLDRRYHNRELEMMKGLEHECVIKLHHHFEKPGKKRDESYLHLVMDYMPETTEEDRRVSRANFAGEQGASDTDLSSPGVIVHVAALLNEYDRTVVKSAAQLRTYVTNKLILESDNQDPRIRIKSLELLGKISDVGLFTDKTEITMRHRPTEELEQMLRERLTKVIEGDVFEVSNPDKLAERPKMDVSEVLGE